MTSKLLFLLLFACVQVNVWAQGLSFSASVATFTRITEIPHTQPEFPRNRAIQALNSCQVDIGRDFFNQLSAGISASYTMAVTGKVYAVGTEMAPVTSLPYYGAGVFGKYRFFKSSRLQPYVYASSGVLFNYPKKLDTYRVETGSRAYSEARMGIQYSGKKGLGYFAEGGLAFQRGIARMGLTYQFL